MAGTTFCGRSTGFRKVEIYVTGSTVGIDMTPRERKTGLHVMVKCGIFFERSPGFSLVARITGNADLNFPVGIRRNDLRIKGGGKHAQQNKQEPISWFHLLFSVTVFALHGHGPVARE